MCEIRKGREGKCGSFMFGAGQWTHHRPQITPESVMMLMMITNDTSGQARTGQDMDSPHYIIDFN